MFGSCKQECNPCASADPVADRIKVDPALLATSEKSSPLEMTSDNLEAERRLEEERRKAEAERKRREAAEAERARVAAEAAKKAEAERLEKERQLLAVEAAEKRRMEEQRERLEEQRRWEEQQHLEEERRLEEQRRFQELRAKEAAEEAERAEDEAAQAKVQKFLKDNNFSSLNSKRSSFMSHKYALHTAVEKKDVEAIGALVRCRADVSLQNSSKKTPEQLANSSNKKGSHDQVLEALRVCAR